MAWSNTPFSAKARNRSLGLKERKVSYVVDSLVDECFTWQCTVRSSAKSNASLLLYFCVVSADPLGRHAARENPAARGGSLFKTIVNQPRFVTANFLLVVVLERVENMVIYVGLNLWRNFKPCYR